MRSRRGLSILFALAASTSGCSEAADSPARDDASSASTATASSTAASGGDGGPLNPGTDDWLGLACEDDAACGPADHCLRATDDSPLGGGPAGGYCTRTCTEDAECPGLY